MILGSLDADSPVQSPEYRASTALRVCLAVLVVVLVGAGAAYALRHRTQPLSPARVVVTHAAFPISPVGRPDGSFRYAERDTGRIREVDPSGQLRATPFATVDVVSKPGQRGLLGLTIDGEGRTFAAWTRATDRRLVVAQISSTDQRIIWLGPPSRDLANGGHLATAPDGRIVIGIGDLQDRTKLSASTEPNGKMLALDPDGRPGQVATVLSSGWNNPFAFAYLPDGTLWVADNAPGEQPERIGRGDRDGLPRLNLAGRRAPSALVALGPNRLGLCGYIDRTMHEVRVRDGRASKPGDAVASPCSVGAARLANGDLVVTTEDRVGETKP